MNDSKLTIRGELTLILVVIINSLGVRFDASLRLRHISYFKCALCFLGSISETHSWNLDLHFSKSAYLNFNGTPEKIYSGILI